METGEQVSQLTMDSIPVFGGMAAANSKLYISIVDGKVMCLEGHANQESHRSQ